MILLAKDGTFEHSSSQRFLVHYDPGLIVPMLQYCWRGLSGGKPGGNTYDEPAFQHQKWNLSIALS
jgi:hypothetical protein